MNLLKAPITAMLVGGLSFLLTTFALVQKPLTEAAHAVPEADVDEVTGFWQRHDPEIDQLLQEVKAEKELLAKRAADLRELEARLAAERAEINQVTQRVAQLQMEFDHHVIRVKEEETANLKKLARLYTTMSPEGASAIFRELDDQVLVKILSLMKEDQSAPLLDAMARADEEQAKRAAALAESLRKTITEKKKSP